MADTPKSSDYASIQDRIEHIQESQQAHSDCINTAAVTLACRQRVDWKGGTLRDDKKGNITNNIPSILRRFNINTNNGFTALTILKVGLKNWSEHSLSSRRHVRT